MFHASFATACEAKTLTMSDVTEFYIANAAIQVLCLPLFVLGAISLSRWLHHTTPIEMPVTKRNHPRPIQALPLMESVLLSVVLWNKFAGGPSYRATMLPRMLYEVRFVQNCLSHALFCLKQKHNKLHLMKCNSLSAIATTTTKTTFLVTFCLPRHCF